MTQLESLWESLLRHADRPIFRRIDDVHPLDFYAGVDSGQERELMLLCSQEPPDPLEFEALEVAKTQRADGRWVLAMRLKHPDLLSPFNKLCSDLVDATRETEAADGPAAVLRHLSRWKRLMQLNRSGLSDLEVRGLMGELLLIESTLIPVFGATVAIKSWTGPSGAAQDFRLPGVALEVKTCQHGSNQISISSADQLDGMGARLFLVVTALSSTTQTDHLSVTLTQLVQRIRTSLSSEPQGLEELNVRLLEAGFSESERAALVFYRPENTIAFAVTDRFPRLTRAMLPRGVLDTTYVLDLATCKQFQVDLDSICYGH